MFIRIATGVRTHFPDRWIEWLMAGTMIWWGWKLTDPATQWANVQAWRFMTLFWSEEAWGWLCVFIGALRFLALVINGTFADTWYSKASPWVRALTAGLGAIVWFMVMLSVSASNTSGAGIYHLPLFLDLWCSLHVFFRTGRATQRLNSDARLP